MLSLQCDESCLHYLALSNLSENPDFNPTELKNVFDFSNSGIKNVNGDNANVWFGTTLDKVQKASVSIQRAVEAGSSTMELFVPTPVFSICKFLENHLTVEGLFRVTGSVRRINALKKSLQEGHELIDEHPHDVANILTLFFRQLSVNLFPKAFYDTIMCIMNMKDKNSQIQAIQLICLLLPRSHLHCLIYLCYFLKLIVNHSSENKMNAYNLAAVFAPNLLRLEFNHLKIEKQDEYRSCMSKQADFVQVLITHSDLLGLLPDSCLDYPLCSKGECIHKSLWEESTQKVNNKRRRSFADRIILTMCSKLRSQSNATSSNESGTSEAKDVRLKRTADQDGESCPAKRRSLQGSALNATDMMPSVVITPYKFTETMQKPQINFVEDKIKTYSECGKEQRHDSGSTSCFNLLPKAKPKKRRSLRNLLRSKAANEDTIVSYPVDPKEDEAAYASSVGQKLANHGSESSSDLPDCEKKQSKNFLSKLRSPFISPRVRRSSRRKARECDVPYPRQPSLKEDLLARRAPSSDRFLRSDGRPGVSNVAYSRDSATDSISASSLSLEILSTSNQPLPKDSPQLCCRTNHDLNTKDEESPKGCASNAAGNDHFSLPSAAVSFLEPTDESASNVGSSSAPCLTGKAAVISPVSGDANCRMEVTPVVHTYSSEIISLPEKVKIPDVVSNQSNRARSDAATSCSGAGMQQSSAAKTDAVAVDVKKDAASVSIENDKQESEQCSPPACQSDRPGSSSSLGNESIKENLPSPESLVPHLPCPPTVASRSTEEIVRRSLNQPDPAPTVPGLTAVPMPGHDHSPTIKQFSSASIHSDDAHSASPVVSHTDSPPQSPNSSSLNNQHGTSPSNMTLNPASSPLPKDLDENETTGGSRSDDPDVIRSCDGSSRNELPLNATDSGSWPDRSVSSSRSPSKDTAADCASLLNDLVSKILSEEEPRQAKVDNDAHPDQVLRPRSTTSMTSCPLKRSRVISRRSGSSLLQECGVVRGEASLHRIKPSPLKKQQRLVKRIDSPLRAPQRHAAISLATKAKLRKNLAGPGKLLLPDKAPVSYTETHFPGDDMHHVTQEQLHSGAVTTEKVFNKPYALSSKIVTNERDTRISRLHKRSGVNLGKASERIKQFERQTSDPTKGNTSSKLSRSDSIQPGRVSATVQRFNRLTEKKGDDQEPLKLSPLPYREDSSLTSVYRLERPWRGRARDDSDVTIVVPRVRPRKSRSLDQLATPKDEKRFKSPLRTPAKMPRGPLILRSVNIDDELDCSPVQRATPVQPRSRAPVKPTE